jgi:microcystin-dependent protein
MQTPYIGNIILFGGNFPPVGWLTCDGSLLQISQYDVLFNLLGTTYGGDGVTTFGLPDLRSRIPLHMGQGPGLSNYVLGQMAGFEAVSITSQTMPQHTHAVACNSTTATLGDPTNAFLGGQPNMLEYVPGATANSVMSANAIVPLSGGQSHANIMPYQAMNYIIATDGIYPSQN